MVLSPFLFIGLFWLVFVMIMLTSFMRRVSRSAADEARRTYRPPIMTRPVERPPEGAKPLPRRRRMMGPAAAQPAPGEITGTQGTSRAGTARRATGSLGTGQMEGLGTESVEPRPAEQDTGADAYVQGASPAAAYAPGATEGGGTAFAASTLFAARDDIARGVVMSEVLGRPASAFAPARPRLLRQWRV